MMTSKDQNLPVNYSSLFMKISDPTSNLENHVAGKVLAEVRQLDNLMEQFTTLHY